MRPSSGAGVCFIRVFRRTTAGSFRSCRYLYAEIGWLQEIRPRMLLEGVSITDVLHDGRRVLVSGHLHDLVKPSAVCQPQLSRTRPATNARSSLPDRVQFSQRTSSRVVAPRCG